MNFPGRPERFFIFLIGILALFALGCVIVGRGIENQLVLRIGWWLGVLVIGFASLPLLVVVILSVVEKLRKLLTHR
jgi:hypothetical protein